MITRAYSEEYENIWETRIELDLELGLLIYLSITCFRGRLLK